MTRSKFVNKFIQRVKGQAHTEFFAFLKLKIDENALKAKLSGHCYILLQKMMSFGLHYLQYQCS